MARHQTRYPTDDAALQAGSVFTSDLRQSRRPLHTADSAQSAQHVIPPLWPVSSTAIRAVAYGEPYLWVELVSGHLYVYANVSRQEYEHFRSAPSLGQHYATKIVQFVDQYPFRRLR